MVKPYANAKSTGARDRRRANHPVLSSQDADLLLRFADSQLVERGLSSNTINDPFVYKRAQYIDMILKSDEYFTL